MAYMSKEQKAEIANLLKKEFGTNAKKRGFTYSLKIVNYSTIEMTIRKGTVDFLGSYDRDLNGRDYLTVMYDGNFTGEAAKIIERALKCLNKDNFDNSDIMTDYFHVGHYVRINIGTFEKPYILEK